MKSEADLAVALEFAQEMARTAGQMILQNFDVDHDVEIKSDNTPVTAIDKAINAKLVESVKERFADHGVLGEEESYHPDREWLWVCDPLDGTKPYLMGIPTATFALALVHGGQPVVAVVYDAFLDLMYQAVKGQGAYCNGRRLRVSERGPEACRLLGSGSGRPFRGGGPKVAAALKQARPQVVYISAAIYKGMLVAKGGADAFEYPFDSPHDVVATKLIVEEAGGKVTDLDGKEQRYDQPINGAIVTNGRVHDWFTGLGRPVV